MSRNVTLLQLRTDVAAQCDFSTSSTGRYTPTLLNRIINQSIQRFRERVSNEGMTHFLVSYSGTISSGATGDFSFRQLDLSALNPAIVRTYGLDIRIANTVKTLAHRPFTERNEFSFGPSRTGQPIAWAHIKTTSLAIMPAPDADYPYTIWYLPVLADLVNDSDTFDGVAGWEVWVLWDCVCQLIARDQYATAYTQAVAERDLAWQDIVRSSTKVSAAGGAFVGRDSMGQAGLMGARPRLTRDLGVGGGPITADTIFGTPDEVGQHITAVADSSVSSGFSWQKRRFWIEPTIDMTGIADASTAIQTAVNARPGSCVYLPEGKIYLGSNIIVPPGVTITGPPSGQRVGGQLYPGNPTVGAQLLIKHTGVGFTLHQQSSILDIEAYYPDQLTTLGVGGSPIVYDFLFDVAANEHGVTLENIRAINPYRFLRMRADIFTCTNVFSGALSRGIVIGRSADVTRYTGVHFKGANYAEDATISAWRNQNGRAFTVCGAEGAEFTNCFAYGYAYGMIYNNELGDTLFRGVTTSWVNGGFDQCLVCIEIANDAGLTIRGGKFASTDFAPSNGAGVAVRFDDDHIATQFDERPGIYLTNPIISGFLHDRPIWLGANSYGYCSVVGGSFQQFLNQGVLNESPNANACMIQVAMPRGATRTGGTGPITDTAQVVI